MTYDLFIYSYSSENVLKEKLTEKLAAQGWSIAFLSPGAFSGKVSVPVLPAQGLMEDNVTILGWQTKSKQAQVMENLLSQFDIKGLEQLDNSLYGGCSFDIRNPYNWSDDYSSEELEEPWDKSALAVLKKARTHYSTSIHGTQGPVSLALQDAVWRAIGELQGGLIENPQSDDYEIYEPDGAGGFKKTHRPTTTNHARLAATSFIFCVGGALSGALAFWLLSNSSPQIALVGAMVAFVLGGLLSSFLYRVFKFIKDYGIF